MDVLCEIQQLIHIIYGGDMNTDLARTPHAHALRNFILDFNLTLHRCARSGSGIYVCKSKRL